MKKRKSFLVLDNVRSAHNVGSVFRTSDAFAIESLFLVGITPLPTNREVQKTALGSNESVSWKHFNNATECIEELQRMNIKITLIEQVTEAVNLNFFKINGQQTHAFVFGNEVNGVSDDFVNVADDAVVIPQFGTKHSLNVSVAVGIVLWHLVMEQK